MQAKDAMVCSLYRFVCPNDESRAGSDGESEREDALDDLAKAVCIYANALRDLGASQADATAAIVRLAVVGFADHHLCSLIALVRACCAVVYEWTTAGELGMSVLVS